MNETQGTTANENAALEAEVNYYRDRVALLRARLYRRGIGTNDRLVELQRRLASAELRRKTARTQALKP
jgi:hypothetical protein